MRFDVTHHPTSVAYFVRTSIIIRSLFLLTFIRLTVFLPLGGRGL